MTKMEESLEKRIVVIVHGAWQATYAWQTVKDNLEQAGLQVVLLQLPGHGNDASSSKALHMDGYIRFVADSILPLAGNVILAGHSMAGMIISGVAELIPGRIAKLVYVAAYVPLSGQSAYALSILDQQSLLGASLIVSEDQSEFDLIYDDITNIFCQDGSAEVKALILDNYRSEPAAPFSEPVILRDQRFGTVEKIYIETLADNGIGHDLQKQMIANNGIKTTYQLDSGHSPSLSMPEALADIFKEIAAQ
jgi:pimeloyl-ACP methyl ester carboxylesterase